MNKKISKSVTDLKHNKKEVNILYLLQCFPIDINQNVLDKIDWLNGVLYPGKEYFTYNEISPAIDDATEMFNFEVHPRQYAGRVL